MKPQKITCIIGGNTYSLSADDTASLEQLAAADRAQLFSLLDAIKQHDVNTRTSIERLADSMATSPPAKSGAADIRGYNVSPELKPERLGAGDVDALMTRLAFEEKASRKTGISRQGVYKFAAGCTALIFLLVLVL